MKKPDAAVQPALLIRGAYVYPADAAANVIPDGAVLVIGERIAAVGTTGDVDTIIGTLSPIQRTAIKTVDARGNIVLPGFVNAHWHELFATRLAFRGALRPPQDRDDKPAFMTLGGDLPTISMALGFFYEMIEKLEPDEAESIARYSMWTQLRSGVTTLGDVRSVNRSEALIAAARGLGMRCMVTTWASDAICPGGGATLRVTRDADIVLARMEAVLRQCAEDLLTTRSTHSFITPCGTGILSHRVAARVICRNDVLD